MQREIVRASVQNQSQSKRKSRLKDGPEPESEPVPDPAAVLEAVMQDPELRATATKASIVPEPAADADAAVATTVVYVLVRATASTCAPVCFREPRRAACGAQCAARCTQHTALVVAQLCCVRTRGRVRVSPQNRWCVGGEVFTLRIHCSFVGMMCAGQVWEHQLRNAATAGRGATWRLHAPAWAWAWVWAWAWEAMN